MSPPPGHRTRLSHRCPLPAALTLWMAIATILVAGSAPAQPVPPHGPHTYSVAQRVEVLLKQARAARTAGRLVQPPGTNAAELYAEILKLDPGNREARDAIIGLREVIHTSLATAHDQSPELQRLNALSIKLAGQQEIGGPTAPAHAGQAAVPPVEHPAPPPAGQAQPPVAHHKAPPPASQGASMPVAPDDIDQLIQRLPIGNIVFNTPNAMQVSQSQTIQLVLSGASTVDELRKQITASGTLSADQIKISDELDVHLTGESFQIQSVTPESQAVGITHPSHWEWQVTPTKRGAQQLQLTVNAVLRIDGVDREVSIQTYDRTIAVNVDWPNSLFAFLSANWQWLWTAIFVPIALVIWRWFCKKREREKL
jgi:hypothetical protein